MHLGRHHNIDISLVENVSQILKARTTTRQTLRAISEIDLDCLNIEHTLKVKALRIKLISLYFLTDAIIGIHYG